MAQSLFVINISYATPWFQKRIIFLIFIEVGDHLQLSMTFCGNFYIKQDYFIFPGVQTTSNWPKFYDVGGFKEELFKLLGQ